MHGDDEVLRQVQGAFAHCERPEHFTDYEHCPECAEHDALLLSRDNESLRIDDVGNECWDPLCFVNSDGFKYFFPGLARLALAEPTYEHGWYPQQLLFHLLHGGDTNPHFRCFDARQRMAVLKLLRHIADTRMHLADEWLILGELQDSINLWSGTAAGNDPPNHLVAFP